MVYIGAHTSIKNGILEGIKYIQQIGGNTAQIFLGSNQSSSLKTKTKLTEDECSEIKRYLELNNFKLFVHAIYLLNFCSFPHTSKRIEYAQKNLMYDIEWGDKIGSNGVIVHFGHQKNLEECEAYQNMVDNIIYILEETSKKKINNPILLETPAGSGSQIANSIEKFKIFLEFLNNKLENIKDIKKKTQIKNRIGFCIDTAHIFSSGHDIRTIDGINKYFNTFENMLNQNGFKSTPKKNYLNLVHLNDSKAILNSKRDLHQGIGTGYIYGPLAKIDNCPKPDYLNVLKELIKISKKKNIPIVLETHGAGCLKCEKDNGWYQQEITLMKNIDNDDVVNDYNEWLIENKKHLEFNNKKIKTLSRTLKKNKTKKQQKFNNNQKIIDILMIVRKFYHIINDNIRANAYSKAIFHLKNYPFDILNGEQVSHLEGIGKKMVEKINTIIDEGTLPMIKYENMIQIIKENKNKPEKVLSEILGFGPKKVKELIQDGYDTITKVKSGFKKGIVNLNNQQQIGLKYHKQLQELIPRKEAEYVHNLIDKIYLRVKKTIKKRFMFLPAGSFPSGKEESKDIDILIVKENTNPINIKHIYERYQEFKDNLYEKYDLKILDVLSIGEKNMMAILEYKYNNSNKIRHIDIKLCSIKELPFSYLHFTSGIEMNKYMRDIAIENGMKLNEKGLFKKETIKNYINKIEELEDKLDMNYDLHNMNKKYVITKTNDNIEKIKNYIGV